ncbi:unnamed protein product, partial [Iphiclides podalirius]
MTPGQPALHGKQTRRVETSRLNIQISRTPSNNIPKKHETDTNTTHKKQLQEHVQPITEDTRRQYSRS